nr:hypothetical protein [Tanacetum cinerariifolium]
MKNLRIAFQAWSENNQQKKKEEEKQITEEQSSVENLILNPSESEDLSDSECDVPACDDFTTFSNLLFDADDDFSSSDDESFFDEDISKKIYSNPLFDEEIISMKIDPHHFNVESDLIEFLLNHNSSIISSSLKIDSLLDEFADELILLKSIPPGIDKSDYDPKEEIHLIEKLLYDNSSPRPQKEFISKISDVIIKSFSPSPIPVEDSDPFMEKIDLFLVFDGPIPLVNSLILLSSGSEDIIFDPGISNDHLSSLEPGVSHRSGTFMKFKVYPNHLNESLMEILSSTCFPMDQ